MVSAKKYLGIGGALFLGPQFIYANPYKFHFDDLGRDMNRSSYYN